MGAALLPVGLGAAPAARADWMVSADAGAALLLTQPQRSLYGPGVTASLAGHRAFTPRLLGGLRLRGGVFQDVAAADVTRADPGHGGFGAALLSLRVRPLGGPRLHTGPWLELAGGGGLTGTLLRPMLEGGLGYGFAVRGYALGPMLRYHHLFQPGSGLDGRDAKMALLGIEVGFSPPPPPPPAPPPPAPPPAPAPKDTDGDGLLDPDDKCPTEPEDKDGFEDQDGCPDPDNDRDGIPDKTDACPNEPEVVNGVDDLDGCPDEGLIVMVDDRVVLEENVLFKTDRARVTSKGRVVLQAVVRLWKQHPEWERMDVEGHADYRGPDQWNQSLSEDRAGRVRKVLIELGLDGERITTKGFGRTKPRVEGRDPESLQKNRRVELVVIRKRPEPAAPGTLPVQPPATHEAPQLAPPPVEKK
jgi:outer membrane protein OmpA-like peptidoglycan-associated protein